MNGCFGQASWPYILSRVWEGRVFFFIHMAFCVSQQAKSFFLFNHFVFLLYHLLDFHSFLMMFKWFTFLKGRHPSTPLLSYPQSAPLFYGYWFFSFSPCNYYKLGYFFKRFVKEKATEPSRGLIWKFVTVVWSPRRFPSGCRIEPNSSSRSCSPEQKVDPQLISSSYRQLTV